MKLHLLANTYRRYKRRRMLRGFVQFARTSVNSHERDLPPRPDHARTVTMEKMEWQIINHEAQTRYRTASMDDDSSAGVYQRISLSTGCNGDTRRFRRFLLVCFPLMR